jgi:hypothetical protein
MPWRLLTRISAPLAKLIVKRRDFGNEMSHQPPQLVSSSSSRDSALSLAMAEKSLR